MSRLDQTLVTRGLAPTRARALDWIGRGLVSVDGCVVTKGGHRVTGTAAIAVADGATHFVSRGADKLIAALDHFGFDPSGCRAADIGASTGGFTEVLLVRGAAHVTAIDVGQAQLHARLRADARVTVREQTDARALVCVTESVAK